MKMKRLGLILLCVLLGVSFSFSALASGVAPCYSHTSTISASISIDGNVITSYGQVTAKPSNTSKRTHVTIYLQRYTADGWKTVDWWAANSTDDLADAIGHKAVEEGYSYRTRAIGKIFSLDWSLLEQTEVCSDSLYY